jgi:surfeit locus 1 family protein
MWQLRKGQAKVALAHYQAQQDRAAPKRWRGELGEAAWHRRYIVHGRWLPQEQVLLDNRVQDGKAGYYLVAPLKLDGGAVMAVFRGWLPRSVAGLPMLPPLATGEVDVLIRLAPPAQHYVELAPDTAAGIVWQNLDWARYRQVIKAPVVDAVAYQLEGEDGLMRAWPVADQGADRHFSYAGQWFLFATLAAVLFVYFHVKRPSS